MGSALLERIHPKRTVILSECEACPELAEGTSSGEADTDLSLGVGEQRIPTSASFAVERFARGSFSCAQDHDCF
jgi:hypothetical protein